MTQSTSKRLLPLILLVVAIPLGLAGYVRGHVASWMDAVLPAPRARAVHVRDVPLPTERPFTPGDGETSDGYPIRTADGAALIALLHARRFEELTRYVEAYEADAEADVRREFWIVDAVEALGNGDPRNRPLLDEWARRSPRSFAPYAARAAHALAAAWGFRGEGPSIGVSFDALRGARLALADAPDDIEAAQQWNPRAIAPLRTAINVALLRGDRGMLEDAHRNAARHCRLCLSWRTAYVVALRPRWGGSLRAERAFAAESTHLARENARLVHVEDFVTQDLQSDAADSIVETATRMLATHEYWQTYVTRAKALRRLHRAADALADAERAFALRPGNPHVLEILFGALYDARRFTDAAEVLLHALRLSPVDQVLIGKIETYVSSLHWEAVRFAVDGDGVALARATAIAMAIDPTSSHVRDMRGRLVSAMPRFAALRESIRAEPDSFEAVRALDAALAGFRAFDKLLPFWDDYLARHPDDARAYLERGGTNRAARNYEACEADFARACELGSAPACGYRGRCAARGH